MPGVRVRAGLPGGLLHPGMLRRFRDQRRDRRVLRRAARVLRALSEAYQARPAVYPWAGPLSPAGRGRTGVLRFAPMPRKPAPSKPASPRARTASTSAKPSPSRSRNAARQPVGSKPAPTGEAKTSPKHTLGKKFAIAAARCLADAKCRDVVVIDVRGRSQVCDFTVVATGSSDRQMRSAGEHVEEAGLAQGMKLYRHNLKEAHATWVLLDFVDVVVHVFEPASRLYYDIEMLWGDAPRVAWERPGDIKSREARTPTITDRNRAGLRDGDLAR